MASTMMFNPQTFDCKDRDPVLHELVTKTVAFFEGRGKKALKEKDHAREWYDDYLAFQKEAGVFATLLTPAGEGDGTTRWDTARNAVYSEVLAFYGLAYWYVWQVSILGLGPIWMSANAEVKAQTARFLRDGGIFAFGLSEKEHGADIYSTEMALVPDGEGKWLANGSKYYIGNGHKAALVSTLGKYSDSGDFVFFAVGTQHEKYSYLKNTVNSQSTVAEYRLNDYPIVEGDILHKGRDAWDAALNTINVGKYNLGWASIGMCEHALYEAVTHAAHRILYGNPVTDFPHVRRLLTDAKARLVAMKVFARRAADYMRSASPEDRRYLLYNPIVKMKVTMQGEQVINDIWDVIAAKGFEADTYFEMAARDIRALPKLEGTAHVNLALIVKFMPNFFMNPGEFPVIPRRDDDANDDFLFKQGPTKGLGRIQFHDFAAAYDSKSLPNIEIFKQQIEALKMFGMMATPSAEQSKDIDFLLNMGELFTLVAYGQLLIEGAALDGVSDDMLDQCFDVIVREFSRYALDLYHKPSATETQQDYAQQMMARPAVDPERAARVWQDEVFCLVDAYEMPA